MNTQLNAMKQALEAFEQGLGHLARDTLRIAIEAAEKQEPVAWAVFADNGNIRIWSTIAEEVRTMAETQGLKISPLYTTPPAAQPAPVRGPTQDYRPMDTAPTDGTIVRLLVEFEDHSLEEGDKPVWTIGTCNLSNDEDPAWLFAGWNWSHDCFTEGRGKAIGWLPMLDATPPAAQPAPAASSSDPFLQGVCVALQAVTGSGDGVLWREIVEAAGSDELLQYAAHIEPEEWELAGFSAFAKSEMKCDKPKRRAGPPAAQPAVPLTEPELRAVLEKTNHMITNTMRGPFWPELEQACRAIEAAHGIGVSK